MAETITLPRSGVVLKDGMSVYESVIAVSDGVRTPCKGWAASIAGLRSPWCATRDEAVAWLDERVLALRAALLPADARERVAKVLWSNAATIVDEMDQARRVADLVLAALGGQP